jgi:asparagine synthase (glutamine-hydrolysing)
MCGFLLDYNFQTEESKASFIDLLSHSQHRGPDAQGCWSNGTTVQIGFNRLSILELTEAGRQTTLSFGWQYYFFLMENNTVTNYCQSNRRSKKDLVDNTRLFLRKNRSKFFV